jgi:hypothetical protein
MPLAIATDLGQQHEQRGRELLEAFARHTRSQLIVSDPQATAALDAVFHRDGVLVAVAEAKTRVKYDYAAIAEYGTYLITHDKLETLQQVSAALAVPSFLVTELSDGVRLYWQLTDASGRETLRYRVNATETLATSVGTERVVRVNAFLPLEAATIWGTGE